MNNFVAEADFGDCGGMDFLFDGVGGKFDEGFYTSDFDAATCGAGAAADEHH